MLYFPPNWLSGEGGTTMQDTLGFPDKADQRAEPGTGWTPAVLNHVLHAHVVIVVDSGHSAWTSFGWNGSRSCSGGTLGH